MPLPDPIDAPELAAEMRRSDGAYFAAAAECRQIAGGAIYWMPGLQHLAAGCIVQPSFPDAPLETFLADGSETLLSIGSRLFRFYTASLDSELEKGLAQAGFEPSVELAVVRRASGERPGLARRQGLDVRRVATDADWLAKAQLASAMAEFPDGKSADHLEWTELERRKADSGYGTFWIVEQEGFACGTFGLSRSGTILRLKNLAVDPAFRRSGVASAAIDFASTYAAEHGFDWLGAFAIAGGKGEGLYRSCGFEVVGAQTEWSRIAVPDPAFSSAMAGAWAC